VEGPNTGDNAHWEIVGEFNLKNSTCKVLIGKLTVNQLSQNFTFKCPNSRRRLEARAVNSRSLSIHFTSKFLSF
jgi:hypothetical protein